MLSKLISKLVNKWLNNVHLFFYPYTCVICEQAAHPPLDLCTACQQELPLKQTYCTICDIELTTSNTICGRCLKDPPYYDKIFTLYRYQQSARYLIHALKFQSKHQCARIMGSLMAKKFKQHPIKPDAIIAVPLHPKRLRQRGFNQAEEIARYIHQATNIPILNRQLKRTINTANQSSLTAVERQKNIRGAFVFKPKNKADFIAIIDDVVTTGSTANEIAKVLKKAGVKRVEIWAFARA